MNLLEELQKTHHSCGFLNDDLRGIYSNSDDQILNLIIYDLLCQSAEIENKIKQILEIKMKEKS